MCPHSAHTSAVAPFQSGRAIVVYFDILGFSEIVSRRNSQELYDALIEVWRDLSASGAVPAPARHYLFSDCGFLLYPLDSAYRPTVADSTSQSVFNSALVGAQIALDTYLTHGFFLRGALSVGEVSYGDHLLVGIPVVNAVRYEAQTVPGPFILVPAREREQVMQSEHFIASLPEHRTPVKGHGGEMLASIVCPTDHAHYVEAISHHSQQHAHRGPADLASFYRNALEMLAIHRPHWFASSEDGRTSRL